MKNLLVYIHPDKVFVRDYELLLKIQIDNSLSLGWDPKDILFISNFPFQYNGVKTTLVPDVHYCAVRPRSIKTAIIPYLVDEGIIEPGKIYWNHDLDAIQLNKISEKELGLENYDAGLTDYGWRERWCMGSFFIKSSSKDIFELAKPMIYQDIEDETVMMELTKAPAINNRCKRLNIRYNFGMRQVEDNFRRAKKPIKVVHFHPEDRRLPTLDIFMYGKNGLNKPILNKRLIKIFNSHGIR